MWPTLVSLLCFIVPSNGLHTHNELNGNQLITTWLQIQQWAMTFETRWCWMPLTGSLLVLRLNRHYSEQINRKRIIFIKYHSTDLSLRIFSNYIHLFSWLITNKFSKHKRFSLFAVFCITFNSSALSPGLTFSLFLAVPLSSVYSV